MADTRTAERRVRQPVFPVTYVYALAVVDGADGAAIHRITQPETVLGRTQEADFQVDDDLVSNRHCMIRVDGPVCTLVELGSRNGTWVNARAVVPERIQRLRHLDMIRVGDTRILLLSGRVPQAPQDAAD